MLTINQQFTAEITAHALQEDPNECCGILAGPKDADFFAKLYRITNTVASPVRYLMDPQEMLNAMEDAGRNGWEITAFYHSHTHSAAEPSPTDIRMAQQSGWLGEDVYYILISLQDKSNPVIRAFYIHPNGKVIEQPYATADA